LPQGVEIPFYLINLKTNKQTKQNQPTQKNNSITYGCNTKSALPRRLRICPAQKPSSPEQTLKITNLHSRK
jgi:hypothetical protein